MRVGSIFGHFYSSTARRGVTRGGDIGDMSPQLFDRGGQSIKLPPPQLLKSDFFYRTLIFIKEKYDSNIEKTRAGFYLGYLSLHELISKYFLNLF